MSGGHLDLDHVGAQIGEQSGDRRPAGSGGIDNADSVEQHLPRRHKIFFRTTDTIACQFANLGRQHRHVH